MPTPFQTTPRPRIRLRMLPQLLPQNVELSVTDTAVVWRYVGQPDDAWQELIEVDDFAATVEVGEVTTLAAGEQATVQNVGTDRNVVLNIGLPQGGQGIEGPQGEEGPVGPQGPSVSDGDKGDIVVSGSGATWTLDSSVVTTFARTILDDPDAAAVRTTLGLSASFIPGLFWSNMASQPNWQNGYTFPSAVIIGENTFPLITPGSSLARNVIAIGSGALYNADPIGSGVSLAGVIAIGTNTMSRGQPGGHNIAIGSDAMCSVDGGHRNIALGSLALHYLTSGARNIMIGRDAGHSITTGTDNVGVGYLSAGVGMAPIGLDGLITKQWELSPVGMASIGVEALRYNSGNYNTAAGFRAGNNMKNGGQNALVGANAGGFLERNRSYAGKLLNRLEQNCTYSQTGTTITISGTGLNAIVGNEVSVAFTSGPLFSVTNEQGKYTVVSAADANTFTITSPASTSASGNCKVWWLETNTTEAESANNVMLGYGAGSDVTRGSRNVLIGPNAGTNATFAGGGSFDERLVIGALDTGRPLIVGDFTNGRVVINGAASTLGANFNFAVYDRATTNRLFSVDSTTGVMSVIHTDAGSAIGPVLDLRRESTSPANNDAMGSVRWSGRDSANNYQQYADISGEAIEVTSGSEAFRLVFRTNVAGANAQRMVIAAGVQIGSPTSGDMGAGTLNMDNDIYRDGLKVVGPRVTGWAAPTGTATRTTFATSTVTLPLLAERVKALIDDLTSHGLIGT